MSSSSSSPPLQPSAVNGTPSKDHSKPQQDTASSQPDSSAADIGAESTGPVVDMDVFGQLLEIVSLGGPRTGTTRGGIAPQMTVIRHIGLSTMLCPSPASRDRERAFVRVHCRSGVAHTHHCSCTPYTPRLSSGALHLIGNRATR